MRGEGGGQREGVEAGNAMASVTGCEKPSELDTNGASACLPCEVKHSMHDFIHRHDKKLSPVLLGRAVNCFVKCFLRVPHMFCNFPAAQASRGDSQKIVYKTSYPTNGSS